MTNEVFRRRDKEGDERHGHPVTTKTNENVKTMRTSVRTDRRFNSRMTEELNTKTGTARKMLTSNLNNKRVRK